MPDETADPPRGLPSRLWNSVHQVGSVASIVALAMVLLDRLARAFGDPPVTMLARIVIIVVTAAMAWLFAAALITCMKWVGSRVPVTYSRRSTALIILGVVLIVICAAAIAILIWAAGQDVLFLPVFRMPWS